MCFYMVFILFIKITPWRDLVSFCFTLLLTLLCVYGSNYPRLTQVPVLGASLAQEQQQVEGGSTAF